MSKKSVSYETHSKDASTKSAEVEIPRQINLIKITDLRFTDQEGNIYRLEPLRGGEYRLVLVEGK